MTNIAELKPQAVAHSVTTTSLVLDSESLNKMMALADIMAKGIATIPKHLQKNSADCLAVVMQAMQWQMNPFAVAQKTHVVNGVLGYEAQLVNAVITSKAPTKDRLNYEWFGEWDKVIGKFKEIESKKKTDEDTGKPLKYRVPDWSLQDEKGLGVKVWATMKGESEPRVLKLELSQCRVRNSPLWADDPRQQIAYLAVKRWSRLHCPDVIMGVYSPDELEPIDEPARIQPDSGPRPDILPEYPPEAFEKSFPKYRDGIESGRKTADEAIDAIETKYTLTDEMKDRLRACTPTQKEQPIEGEIIQ